MRLGVFVHGKGREKHFGGPFVTVGEMAACPHEACALYSNNVGRARELHAVKTLLLAMTQEGKPVSDILARTACSALAGVFDKDPADLPDDSASLMQFCESHEEPASLALFGITDGRPMTALEKALHVSLTRASGTAEPDYHKRQPGFASLEADEFLEFVSGSAAAAFAGTPLASIQTAPLFAAVLRRKGVLFAVSFSAFTFSNDFVKSFVPAELRSVGKPLVSAWAASLFNESATHSQLPTADFFASLKGMTEAANMAEAASKLTPEHLGRT